MTDRYFHYTTIDALHEIVTNRQVWFSSLEFMNDEMEGLEMFEALIRLSKGKLGNSERNLFDGLVSTLTRWQFSFCASRLKDDISQWRAYTKLGRGVCIEFDDRLFDEPYIDRIECVYQRSEKEDLIKERGLHITGKELNQAISNPSGAEDYIVRFSRALASLKHHSFSPESEVRWVVSLSGLSDSTAEVKFRTHRLGLVPYLALPINLQGISSIWLGPKVPQPNKKSVEDFLIHRECPGLVRQSEVTLR